jgi:hypothetical protein
MLQQSSFDGVRGDADAQSIIEIRLNTSIYSLNYLVQTPAREKYPKVLPNS